LAEPQIVIENQEELIFLLSETLWLEHMVMLAYLFATLSFKTEISEGLAEEQLEAVKGWNVPCLIRVAGTRRDRKKTWERQRPNS
jgi:hypothetical protein